ncbi:hypothetical protein ACFJI0_04035 [Hydrogenophaga sp. UC242_53]|uniref:hypothetical protein n=1 Tax=Hydrogenophaga sp. UC242_53 TaxID=3350170 RepID=UPI0036D2E95C
MKRLFSAIETVAALFLLLIALLTAGNVLLRYAFSMQIPDWFDGTQMLQGIAMFWGIALRNLLRHPHRRGHRVGAPGPQGPAPHGPAAPPP